jgi:hypothetical protein
VPNVPQAQKSFWTHTMELLGEVGHVESHFGLFGDCVSVSAGHSIGSEIVLNAHDGTAR